MLPWKKKKLIAQLENSFGKPPAKDYDAGDMDWIRTWYDACRAESRDPFYVDETTWKDLDMDDVYQRINSCQCTAGEQYLYYMLRRPMDRETFDTQQGLIRLMESNPPLRLKIRLILSHISNKRSLDLTSVFRPKDTSSFWLILYSLMAFLLVASIFMVVVFGITWVLVPTVLLAVNSFFHEYRRIRCEHEIDRTNYCVSLAFGLQRIRKLKQPELNRHLGAAYKHLDQIKPVLRTGPVMSRMNSDLFQALFTTCFLTDLIAFEILKKRLAKYHDHFLAVHEAVGRMDASVAVASCRAEWPVWCEPEIDYEADHPYMQVSGMVHPMLRNPVPNDLSLEKSMLITGSNASGKSTYLRSAVLCALMAQTLCTCTCGQYKASSFRPYTSMALSDDLLAGESYYMAEIKSLKRILDAREKEGFILCAIDEVLRGTNTIERIAASVEVLKALNRPGTLCLVATHDAELCSLAGDAYELTHFEETVCDSDIHFDYQLKPGPATSRNAIHLLKLMGFDDALVSAAYGRADRYAETGKWI
uniref:DNA mismatch repair protein MutS domain protein n=1 Tax=uncultured bacterium Contig15 TaxID=1393441 RepID=W0FGT7_9BACT|nr:DNA mismatch repair protein MutS domain protein [uncultured bacterium Contig15]